MTTDLGTAAVRYARRGFPVFPVAVRGKAPLLSGSGYLDATTNVEQVRRWWTDHPRANIGAVPGAAGLIVLDWDSEEAEREVQRLGLYAEPRPIVRTARGEHIYARHPGGTIGNRNLGPIHVRADRGYVLLPPSVHPSGHVYTWARRCAAIELPPAALRALRRDEERRQRAPSDSKAPVDADTPRRRAYVVAAIEAECLELAQTSEGGRNNRLNEAAFSLARFVDTGEADPAKLADTLHYAASHTGLPDHEIERTIRSAFGARGVPV